MILTNPILLKKKEQFDAIYLNLHRDIRAHCTHVGIVTGVMSRNHEDRFSGEYGLYGSVLNMAILRGGDYHDIGKHLLSYAICRKTDRLNQTEQEIIRRHPRYTVQLLTEYADVLFENEGATQIAIDMGLYHHERSDGSGYPSGLEGEEIPFLPQLCILANFLDEAVGHRRGDTFDTVAKQILKNKNGWFSPGALLCFDQNLDEIRKLYTSKYSWLTTNA